ncbi:MAG: hypothetical protein EOP85_22110 [Verrucomicrobiaceae bacterium]|nr:MAG: hypothetical protein EOP85_22110 [Verrucomicrobiaceae bacterium]
MDAIFLIECSPEGWKRIHRAWNLSRALGFRGINFLVPRQISHQELGYGQGEGQVDVGGIEVGIYFDDAGHYQLVIHDVVESRWNESVLLVDEFCRWWSSIAKSPAVAVQKK